MVSESVCVLSMMQVCVYCQTLCLVATNALEVKLASVLESPEELQAEEYPFKAGDPALQRRRVSLVVDPDYVAETEETVSNREDEEDGDDSHRNQLNNTIHDIDDERTDDNTASHDVVSNVEPL